MARFKRIVDVSTGLTVDRPYTRAEEDAADAAAAELVQIAAQRADRRPDFGADVPDLDADAKGVVVDLRAYVATQNPNPTQTTAVVKVLCRVALWFIRRQFP